MFVTLLKFLIADNLISTFYTVCDVKDSCSKKFGPNIITKLNVNYTKLELDYKLQLIKNAIFRMEYNYAFSIAFSCLTTLKVQLSKYTLVYQIYVANIGNKSFTLV